jgi:hypothetical protein
VSWQASDWVWRHCKLKGIPRYILLALAHRVFKQKSVTGPTSLETIVDMTGMGQRTIQRSIDELEKAGDLKVVKAGRRGTTHRYELAMQPRFQVLSEPIEPDGAHWSERPLSVAPQATDAAEVSLAGAASVGGQPGQCHQPDGPVSVAALASAYVQASSEVRTESTTEQDGTSAAERAAASPRSLAQEPNDDGNYAVIEKLAIVLLQEHGGRVDRFEDGESGFREALKWRCAALGIVYGGHPEVPPDVTARACASARVIVLRARLSA